MTADEYDRDPEVEMEYAKVNVLAGLAEIAYGVRRWFVAAAHAAEEYADDAARTRRASREPTRAPVRPRDASVGIGGRAKGKSRQRGT